MKRFWRYAVVNVVVFLHVFVFTCCVDAALIDVDKLTLSGFLKNATSINVDTADDMDQFLKIRSTAQLELEYQFTDNIHFFTILREWYDSAYDAERAWRRRSGNRKKMSRTKGTDWLRECYLDYYSENLDIRIGKQQVVWGTADGVKILDLINPIDYREFNLELTRSLDADVKIPLWMTKIEYSPSVNGTLQLLIIPDYEPNFIPPADTPYSFRATNVGEQGFDTLRNFGADVIIDNKKPGRSFENTKIGVRWLDVIDGFEYTLNYYHGYSSNMTRHFLGIRPLGIPFLPGAAAFFEDRYAQTETLGASFSKALTKGPLRGYNFRGEFTWVHNNKNGYGTKDNQVGVGKVDQYNYVLGVDKYFWTNWLFSFQLIQFWLEREKEDGYYYLSGPTMAPLDQDETILSLRIATDFMHERMKPDILIQWGDNNDWEISPRVEFELRDYLILSWGMNIFSGHSDTLFGQFRNRDTMYFEVKVGF